ncbi:MAG: GGGtGRT protein, partial [Clostridia bacterium]|nr:GGGtGRT protein [Clostridia bacterium]
MSLFEGYERREVQTLAVMKKYGIKDFEDALKICTDKGFNPYEIVQGIQNICFENAKWAYTLGCA